MNEALVLGGTALAALSGVPGLFLDRRAPTPHGERAATALLAAAAALGVAGAAGALLATAPSSGLALPWSVPGGVLAVRVDAVAAMFLLQIFVVAALGAVYGLEYWALRDHPDDGRKLRLFYGLMTAGMALLVVARNTVLFLGGWEIMALAAFFTVTTEDRDPAVRQVGFVYLVATRLGTLCLLAFFALLHHATGGFGFVGPPGGAAASPGLATALFVLGVAGFGLKAGLMPLHVWLPGAHSAAPSHVSALMSGVLIKMGIYGLVRLGALFADPPLWWGGTLLALGAASGVLGVAFAIGQHDLKRLLAYHSVENIGIIVMGLGLALLGRSLGRADLVALGLAGALLHTWNHGLFKSLLFLGAGAVVHATHTREIDHLGGLARAMPRTAALFLVGAVAICGLPPLNGFVSELCVYLGLFRAVTMPGGGLAWLGAGLAAPALALIGALAVACFVKVVGAVFLGTPRTAHAAGAHEPGARMLVPMAVLAALCALIGVAPALVAPIVARAVDAWAAFALTPAAATAVAPSAAGGVAAPLADVVPFGWISVASAALIAFLAAGGWALRARLRTAPTAVAPTWDCGYAAPTPRMQYTSSSFAQMLVGLFGWALRPQTHTPHLAGLFPHKAHFQSHVPDAVLDRAALPAAARAARALGWFRWMQHGSIHAYLVYVLVTLLVLLLWRGALA